MRYPNVGEIRVPPHPPNVILCGSSEFAKFGSVSGHLRAIPVRSGLGPRRAAFMEPLPIPGHGWQKPGKSFDPWRAFFEAGLCISMRTDLPDGLYGATDAERRWSWIRTDMSWVNTRSVLAHELVHHVLGHSSAQTPEVEQEVENHAVMWLIDAEEMTSERSDDIEEWAARLKVTTEDLNRRLILERRRSLSLVG